MRRQPETAGAAFLRPVHLFDAGTPPPQFVEEVQQIGLPPRLETSHPPPGPGKGATHNPSFPGSPEKYASQRHPGRMPVRCDKWRPQERLCPSQPEMAGVGPR